MIKMSHTDLQIHITHTGYHNSNNPPAHGPSIGVEQWAILCDRVVWHAKRFQFSAKLKGPSRLACQKVLVLYIMLKGPSYLACQKVLVLYIMLKGPSFLVMLQKLCIIRYLSCLMAGLSVMLWGRVFSMLNGSWSANLNGRFVCHAKWQICLSC